MKAIIYDLDGTLLYTLEDLANAVNYSLNKHGHKSRSISEIRDFIGNGVTVLMNRCTDFKCTEDEIATLLSDFTPRYLSHMYDTTKPYDGVIDVMKQLKAQGYAQAIASNKLDSAVKELNDSFFEGLCDAAIGAPQDKRKPNPEVINLCLKELNLNKEDVIYIGDTEVDLETSANAGIKCIAACWGFRDKSYLKEKGATMFAESPKDLINIISSL